MKGSAQKVQYSAVYSLLFLSSLLFPALAKAATFCASTASQLTSALYTAESNGEDDLVQLVQGTYQGHFLYSSSSETYDLTLEGGYVAGCASREVDPANTVLDGMGEETVLILVSTQSADFAVDGLTLQNGAASEGGGLYATTTRGKVSLSNSAISSNRSKLGGSGVRINGANTVNLTQNEIISNTSGGVCIYDAKVANLTNNEIISNTGGSGVYIYADTSSLTGNTIISNTGGGVYINGGNTVSLTNNEISSNTSYGSGGGVSIRGNTVNLIGNTIISNISNDGGGGVYISSVNTASLVNNEIVKNIVTHGAGGGARIFATNTLTLNNNTFSGNEAIHGGGLWLWRYDNNATADIYNNIIWGNKASKGADLYLDNDGDNDFLRSPINLFHNDFDWSKIFIRRPFLIDFSNLNNEDPLFVDSVNGDYHLSAGSPVIDRGDNNAPALPANDKDGNPRIFDGDGDGVAIADMGAYEYGSLRLPIPDAKANGSDGPLTVPQGELLTVTVALNPGSHSGKEADWWVAATSPFGLYWYTLDQGWLRSHAPLRAYGGPLFDLPSYTVLEMAALPPGSYTFYFGCDMDMDGQLDMDQLYSDSVEVSITAP